MEHGQPAFDNMKDKPLDEMTAGELISLQWLVMQELKHREEVGRAKFLQGIIEQEERQDNLSSL